MLYVLRQLITEVLFNVSGIAVYSMSICAKIVAIASVCVRVVAGVLSILMCSSSIVMHGESTHACVLLSIVPADYISDDL